MSVESELRTRLESSTAVSALVSTRVYPTVLPQDVTLPAVSYFKVSGVRTHAMGTDPGLAHPQVQVSCWGATYTSAHAVKEAVRSALSRWASTGVVLDTFLDNEVHLFESDDDTHHIALDFTIHHTE